MKPALTAPDLSRLPWVRILREPSACAATIVSRRGCRTPARWSYTFLPSMGDPADVYDGQRLTFCTIHLLREIRYERREAVRARRWLLANR